MVAAGNEPDEMRHDESDEPDDADRRYGHANREGRSREDQVAKIFHGHAEYRRLEFASRNDIQMSGEQHAANDENHE